MKRVFTFLFLLCFMMQSWAQGIATTDYLTISDLTVVPGSSNRYYFTVSLVGSKIYTAFEMDIHFPPGLDVEFKNGQPNANFWKSKGTIFPYEEDEFEGTKNFKHMLVSSYNVVSKGDFRLSCISLSSAELTATSGPLFYVYVTASPYLKPGEATLKVDGCHVITKQNAQQYNVADQTLNIKVANQSTVPLNISATNKYGTCVLPFDAELPAGVKAFSVINRKNGFINLTEEKEMKAYTPYILYAENGYTGTLSGTVDESKYVETAQAGYLYGAVTEQVQTEGYVLQNKGDGTKFYWLNGYEYTIPEGKCWVDFPIDYQEPKAFYSISMNGGTTGIEKVETNSTSKSLGNIYDLNGNKVSTMLPGNIYIVNGKKVMKIK